MQAHKRTKGFGLDGLSVSVDAGLLVPNDKQANFYRGTSDCPNTIERVFHSQAYGEQMWQNLKNKGYLQGIGSYHELEVAEYPDMYYKLTYQIGLGIRYDYPSGWGWLLRFDYSQLTAAGQFLLYNAPGAGVMTNQDRYVNCPIAGVESRIYIDFAISKRFVLGGNFELEADLGFNFNNTKVKSHDIQIGGSNYSILDVWGGHNDLYAGIGSYEYVNQGGLGIGGFGTLALSYVIPGTGSIDLGYSCYDTQTVYTDYNKSDAYALQHVVFVRLNINGFSLFNAE
ncbi:MAG: hypothetical protein KBT04_08430 [Bacteroidales bacterium]|nr:hypothetical protein [Candidatus Colimorpha onthohippi]